MAIVNAEMTFGMKLVEEVASPSGFANAFDYSMPTALLTFGPLTVPVANEVHNGVFALVAGTLLLSMVALPRTGRTTLDLTGDRVLGFTIKNLGVANLSFVAATTNGYPMFQGTTPSVVTPGGMTSRYSPTGFGTVGPTLKDITVTGTGTDTFQLWLIAGPV